MKWTILAGMNEIINAPECISLGCVPSAAVAIFGGGWGVCLGWGVCPGMCLPGGCVSALWTEFLTHACENITFPQLLLRTVMKEIRFMVNVCKQLISTTLLFFLVIFSFCIHCFWKPVIHYMACQALNWVSFPMFQQRNNTFGILQMGMCFESNISNPDNCQQENKRL